jgi:3-dehydroquinate synthase
LPTVLRSHAPAHHFAIISDSNVAPLYALPLSDRLVRDGLRSDVFIFEAGEPNKTRASWASLTDAMLAAGIGRDGCVIAVGGGVTTDLAGFVAATFMRGISLVLVPTSLLAMIDASIGGKTGVDSPAGKNLVGAFHFPRFVAVDPDVLRTLPDADYRAGLAEAVKHGAIADASYMNWLVANAVAVLRRDVGFVDTLILRSIEIKAALVSRDEREAGIRAALNFGHTIGHAIERLSNFTVPHGHAVAIGMVVEARLGEAEGVTLPGTASTLQRALEALGLPVALPPGLDPLRLAQATGSDKKVRSNLVRYALVARLGEIAGTEGAWTHAVATDRVVATLGA